MGYWRQAGFRIAAMLLAAVVCGDVTLDAACDPIATSGPTTTAVSAVGDVAHDACADFCMPDCFCCSRSEASGPVLVVPPLSALSAAPPVVATCAPEGVRPVPELPPLLLA
jgi:hypothetical protein